MLAALLAIGSLIGPEAPTSWRDAAAAVVSEGIRRRLFPGAVMIVGRGDSILFARGFGRLSWDRGASKPDPESTRWDLASLTKVVATASAAMVLVDAGRLDLDAPVARYLPGFAAGGKDRVTVRMLLDHTSGLPAYRPFYRTARSRADVLEAIAATPVSRPPGGTAEYSDLNAIALGAVVEAVSAAPLDGFAGQAVFRPLGMLATGFAVEDKTRVAPSLVVEGRAAPGVVSDPNARAMGGVAGHAGLFATGLDLARFAQGWLRRGAAEAGRWVSDRTMGEFLAVSRDGRALGWETPGWHEPDRSPFGRAATPTTYGHTGWTGTFLWFDPARDLFLVLLTNRSLGSNGARSLRAMREIRARLSDAVAAAGR